MHDVDASQNGSFPIAESEVREKLEEKIDGEVSWRIAVSVVAIAILVVIFFKCLSSLKLFVEKANVSKG